MSVRGCSDQEVTAHGRAFLGMCEEAGLRVCTGLVEGDHLAAPTFKQRGACRATRLDHVAISAALWPSVHSVTVGTQLGSDHWPLQLQLQADAFRMVQPALSGSVRARRVWRSGARDSYAALIASAQVQDRIQRCVVQAAAGQAELAISGLHAAIGAAADAAGLRKRKPQQQHARPRAPYFDAECMALKLHVRAAYRRREDVHQLELDYHSLVRSKRRRHELAALRSLVASRCLQSRPFWRELRFRGAELPLALRSVDCWGPFLAGVADSGVGDLATLPTTAYPFLAAGASVELEAAITPGEVLEALHKLNNGRASGALGLPAEFLRYAQAGAAAGSHSGASEHLLLAALTAVLQAAFTAGRLPAQFNVGLVTPIFKKGDELDTNNYRPITVLEPIMRLYASILNARLVQYTESQGVRVEEQAGFRPCRSTTHNLFMLQHFADRHLARKEPLYLCFLDLKAAYDRVSRPLLWQALQRLGVGGKMLAAIQSLYANSTAAGPGGPGAAVLHRCQAGLPAEPYALWAVHGWPAPPFAGTVFWYGAASFWQAACLCSVLC